MPWTVIATPVNDSGPNGVNRSAVAVMITDGATPIEATRIGLVRRNTKNPEDEFEVRLQIELDKAFECAATCNELADELNEMVAKAEREAVKKAKARVKEIFGNHSVVPV